MCNEPKYPEACSCECHEPGVVMLHCAPCCNKCEHCGIRVATGHWKDHLLSCDLRDDKTDSVIEENLQKVLNKYPDPVNCVFGACKCLVCGSEQGFHRAGCRCWDLARALEDEEYGKSLKMQYGMYYKTESNTAEFISLDDIKILLSNGRTIFDTDHNEMSLADVNL